MSAPAALIIALSAIVLLGAIAAWLLNIPPWAIGVFIGFGIVIIGRILRRLRQGRARQEPEGSAKDPGITF